MSAPIRILAEGNNKKGDLLTRLASDLFFALGYENPRFDTQKPGREVDIQASHRHEPRDLIAECKSGKAPIGGADINKFIGVLDVERRKRPSRPTIGYFVSLSGFTSTAIAQEEEAGADRLILLDGRSVSTEIVRSGIVVSPAKAIASAVSATGDPSLELDEDLDLFAHEHGWIWAVYFANRKSRVAVMLVHADGTPLSTDLAEGVISTASAVDDALAAFRVLNKESVRRPSGVKARDKYLRYLTDDFGGITLEGMPTDQHVGSQQFRLEDLYVPLSLSLVESEMPASESKADRNEVEAIESNIVDDDDLSEKSHSVYPLGNALRDHPHIAILGLPGSGKTTSLKRLAVAYADNRRRGESADSLPNEPWFPVLIRCRHLLNNVRQPIMRLILDQIERAEMPEARDDFAALISEEMRKGTVLLLVDGLDEISSSGDRISFVSQLRTFIATYPTCRLVLTSREAGFRSVAAAVNSVCTSFRVDGLSDDAIRLLVSHWHRVVIGTTRAVKAKADELSGAIISNDRVRMLASNPLLLTTLLLVQRWLGQLPRRRTVLYHKAIEVLLMTWNAEGHEPLDPEEALPQLSYVAYCMMIQGRSSITLDELAGMLTSARRDMPELLSFPGMTVHKFVDRVEERSSLMTLSGHEFVDGILKPTYEFKHLTFQEYLAARAIAESWLPQGIRELSPPVVLNDKLNLSPWMEVVGLTAVLSGRYASQIVKMLKDICTTQVAEIEAKHKRRASYENDMLPAYSNLVACVRDEVAITPELATEVIEFCVAHDRKFFLKGVIPQELVTDLGSGRYQGLLRERSYEMFVGMSAQALEFGEALCKIIYIDAEGEARQRGVELDEILFERMQSSDPEVVIGATGALVWAAFNARSGRVERQRGRGRQRLSYKRSFKLVVEQFTSSSRATPLALMQMWALAWLFNSDYKITADVANALQRSALTFWMKSRNRFFARFGGWVFAVTPIYGGVWEVSGDERKEILAFAERQDRARGTDKSVRKFAALVLRYYVGDMAPSQVHARGLSILDRQNIDGKWRRQLEAIRKLDIAST
jgi:hypothetical protein